MPDLAGFVVIFSSFSHRQLSVTLRLSSGSLFPRSSWGSWSPGAALRFTIASHGPVSGRAPSFTAGRRKGAQCPGPGVQLPVRAALQSANRNPGLAGTGPVPGLAETAQRATTTLRPRQKRPDGASAPGITASPAVAPGSRRESYDWWPRVGVPTVKGRALGMHRRVSGSRVVSGGDFTVTSHKSLVLQLCVFRQRVTSRGNVCD